MKFRCSGLFFGVVIGLVSSADAQFVGLWSDQYLEVGASATTVDGSARSDFRSDTNDPFGYSYRNIGVGVSHGSNRASGIARQGSLVDTWRLEATHYGDGSADASGIEGESASGGGSCNWNHFFNVSQPTPYVLWGKLSRSDSAYTSLRLSFDDVIQIDEDRGNILYTGEIPADVGVQLQYYSQAGASAYWERTFRSGLFSGEVFFKLNTVLPESIRPMTGITLSGDVSSLYASNDNNEFEYMAHPLPWNRINQYVLTLLPRRPGKKLVADVVASCETNTATFYIRAFNYRTSQWVVAYQGAADTGATRRTVEFPGFMEDYISPTNTFWHGTIVASITWMGKYGTQPTWHARCDLLHLSYK